MPFVLRCIDTTHTHTHTQRERERERERERQTQTHTRRERERNSTLEVCGTTDMEGAVAAPLALAGEFFEFLGCHVLALHTRSGTGFAHHTLHAEALVGHIFDIDHWLLSTDIASFGLGHEVHASYVRPSPIWFR